MPAQPKLYGRCACRADFTPEGRALVEAQTGFADPAVGFKYEYFSLFFVDLWTGAGEVVIYDRAAGDTYVDVSEDELRSATGLELP